MKMAGATVTTVRPKRSGYLPSLDGWRAIAILGVLMTHDRPWSIGGWSNASWNSVGGDGVNLFFAISGLLICTRILEDEALLGVFRLKAFYVRRLFRIQPAALCYLAVIALLIVLGIVHERWHFWLGGFFLYQNFLYHAENRRLIFEGYFTGHFWTLSVEEHFYIFLSLFLYFVKRYRALALALVLLALRFSGKFAEAHGYYSADTSTRRTYWVIGALIWPAFLALLLREPRIKGFAKRFMRPWVLFAFTFVVVCVGERMHSGASGLGTMRAYNLEDGRVRFLFNFWVIATMLHPQSWTTRVLELAPIRYVGRLSYSIYVWHLLFLCTGWPETHITWPPLVLIGQRPWRYLGILVTAMLSYHLIEKPMMRLGHKLAPPATPGHRDLGPALDDRATASATPS